MIVKPDIAREQMKPDIARRNAALVMATTLPSTTHVGKAVRHGGKHLSHELLELREVSGAGRGWYALRDLGPGVELWKEKAFTVGRNRKDLVRRVSTDLARHAAFCRPIQAPPSSEQQAAASAVESAAEDEAAAAAAEAEGIVACNYFDNGKYTGSMLFEMTSMINHACCPNASVHMVQSEFGAVYARVSIARPVAAGEQVLITYSNAKLFRPAEERPCLAWAFGARCARCQGTLPTEEQERWALLDAAAAAADAAKKLPPRQRSLEVAVGVRTLQLSAAELVASWQPHLFEGERFTEDAEAFRLDPPQR